MSAGCFVVVLLLKGRNFPKRPNCFLVAEAKFDGKIITSDPVEHSDCPQFTEELAWSLDKRVLQQHKIQRTSVKVQFYCQNSSGTSRDLIGYVLLDLRSAGESFKQNVKWCSLLNTKYTKSKPEVQIDLYIDNQHSNILDSSSQTANSDIPSKPGRTLDSSIEPVLNSVSGIYSIGSDDDDPNRQMFVFTVTVALASNLVQLTPSDSALDTRYGYFFYFDLLGNETTTQVFGDVVNPKFETERFSVRISSSLENLKRYFEFWSELKIYFCCYNKVLGYTGIPLVNLVTSNLSREPASVEGIFQLVPSKTSSSKKVKLIPDEMRPGIGASVTLKMMPEDIHHQNDAKITNEGERASPGIDAQIFKGILKKKSNDLFGGDPSRGREEAQKVAPDERPSNPSSNGHLRLASGVTERLADNKNENSRVDEASTVNAFHDAFHHFKMSVDLRSIVLTQTQKPAFIFLKYLYLFFGTSEPIMTETFEVVGNSEAVVPKSFCSFDFAANQKCFEDSVKRVPLVVEVWTANTKTTKGTCMGTAEVPLSGIFQSGDSGDSRLKRWTGRHSITSSSDVDKSFQIGLLNVNLEFVDFGPIGIGQVVTASSQHQTMQNNEKMPSNNVDVRESSEYKTALELELWKKKQMEEHMAELSKIKEKEEKRLENEFKMMDRERILLVSAEKEKYETLSAKLKRNLNDIEKREKLLQCNEVEMEKRSKDMEREHERKMQELREASKKLQDNFHHQLEMERNKLEAAEDKIRDLKKQLSQGESRYQKLLRDFDLCRERTKPESELMAKVNALTLEKIDLEKRLEDTKRCADSYKDKLYKMLHINQRSKQVEKQKMEEENERLRMEVALKRDRLELKEISSSLNRLEGIQFPSRLQSDNASKHRTDDPNGYQAKDKEDREGGDGIYKEDAAFNGGRLKDKVLANEKSVLLKTGLYSESDFVIRNFDKITSENNL